MSEKITLDHLQRPAIVYVRQSSRQQLLHNKESERLQYAMRERVSHLGWSEIEVIDEDQGRSAATTSGRTGFQRMVAEVCLGKVGAVAAIEVSRFARNNRDWHQLIEMCGMVNTLLVDNDAIYDPRRPNDRLLLGLKGSMSEYELDLLRQRSLEARWAKARRGELVIQAPIGFVKTTDQRLEKDPDLRVQRVIEMVFEKFFELGSARQAALWFIDHGIEFPAKRYGPAGWETWWRRPAYRSIFSIVSDPAYAGAYAYGRTRSHKQVVDGIIHKSVARKPLEDWGVLIPGHHEGYISWQDFGKAQAMIRDNGASFQNERRRGAAKRGPALLAGLLRCRRCGRKLMVGYSGRDAAVPRYQCHRGRLDNMEKQCISFGGLPIDAAVAKEILRVIEPCAVDAAVLAVAQQSQQRREVLKALRLELEAARYAAGLAHRQYDAVDPDNRLVATELERRWNEALSKVQALEARVEREKSREQPSPPDRDILGSLHGDLRHVWEHADTDVRLKKRIIRTLVEEIVIDLDADRSQVVLILHWKGGAHSELRTARRRRGQSGAHTSTDVVDAIRCLALICRDKLIAGYLNRNGLLTARGNRWSAMAITSLRNKRGIDVHTTEGQRAGGWMTLTQAAKHLGVSARTIRRLAREGLVKAVHPLHDGPWVFNRADLDEPKLRERLAARPASNAPPAGPPNNQLDLAISTTYRGEAL